VRALTSPSGSCSPGRLLADLLGNPFQPALPADRLAEHSRPPACSIEHAAEQAGGSAGRPAGGDACGGLGDLPVPGALGCVRLGLGRAPPGAGEQRLGLTLSVTFVSVSPRLSPRLPSVSPTPEVSSLTAPPGLVASVPISPTCSTAVPAVSSTPWRISGFSSNAGDDIDQVHHLGAERQVRLEALHVDLELADVDLGHIDADTPPRLAAPPPHFPATSPTPTAPRLRGPSPAMRTRDSGRSCPGRVCMPQRTLLRSRRRSPCLAPAIAPGQRRGPRRR
jgi:hypothetical protein